MKEQKKNIDSYADEMLAKIVACVKTEINRSSPRIESAIVTSVNADGTVDVQLPSDEGSGFTQILNQSGFELKEGDAVEILLKNGSFNNCWITAKHQATVPVNVAMSEDYPDESVPRGNDTVTFLNNVDLNAYRSTGVFRLGNSMTSAPQADCSNSILQVCGDGTYCFQTLVLFSTNVMYHRCCANGSWTAWA